jgi:hypothetical protein
VPLDANDRQAIDDLFARLGDAERQTAPRDAEAEALIRQKLTAQPAAPYYMAQTIVMQEYALHSAQERIGQLERELAERPAAGGFLSGLFGGGRPQPTPRPPAAGPGFGRQPALPPDAAAPGRGGGFLAGAAQTAMGVAGGVLLGNLIAGMFSSNEAAAAAPPAAAEAASPANDAAAEAGGYDDLADDDDI